MNNANANANANGRVFIGIGDTTNKQQPDYRSFVEERSTPSDYEHDAVKGNVASNPVSNLFFSDVNIDALQRGIINMVLNKSCGKLNVGKQSTSELLIVMRAKYLQESINSFIDVVGQVKRLNEQVLVYCIPRIMNELEMHNTYIRDISTLPVPMRHGESTSVAGTKTLERKTFM